MDLRGQQTANNLEIYIATQEAGGRIPGLTSTTSEKEHLGTIRHSDTESHPGFASGPRQDIAEPANAPAAKNSVPASPAAEDYEYNKGTSYTGPEMLNKYWSSSLTLTNVPGRPTVVTATITECTAPMHCKPHTISLIKAPLTGAHARHPELVTLYQLDAERYSQWLLTRSCNPWLPPPNAIVDAL
jgi:hypothetical protein